MKFPKFIILKDIQNQIEIRFGFVEYHHDLIKETDKNHAKKCIGGGLFEIVDGRKEIWLYGESEEYGRVDLNILNKIKLNDNHIYDLQIIDKEYFQTNVDYFKRVNKDLAKYKLVIKDF